jgi:hypothetical protein
MFMSDEIKLSDDDLRMLAEGKSAPIIKALAAQLLKARETVTKMTLKLEHVRDNGGLRGPGANDAMVMGQCFRGVIPRESSGT